MADFMYKHGSEVANMLFGEYDEKLAKEVAYEEGFEDGKAKGHSEGQTEGRNIGEMQKLIQQVCKKLQKGKRIETIAEELEESVEDIERICAAIKKCGSEANVEQIYAAL